MGQRRRPQTLRFGTHDAESAIALELAAVAAVDEAIVGPRGGAGDGRFWRYRGTGHGRSIAEQAGRRPRVRLFTGRVRPQE